MNKSFWVRVFGGDRDTAIALAAILLSVYLVFLSVGSVLNFRHIGKSPIYPASIPVTGKGEVIAVPDIASITYSIVEEGKDVASAQAKATEKGNKAIVYLKGKGIEEKDIKTTNYSISPKYNYIQGVCNEMRCAPGKQVLEGYEVNQSVTVKVRNANTAGDILAGIGSMNVSYVSGLTFTIDDQDLLKRQATEKAVLDAREQAEKVAKSLGVKLGKIVSYYEMGGEPYPMYEGMGGDGMVKTAVAPSVSPVLPTGENKITSTVTISYEIVD